MRRPTDWCRIIVFCVLLWIVGPIIRLLNGLWQVVMAAVLGTAYVIGEARRVAGRGQRGQSPEVTVPEDEMRDEMRPMEIGVKIVSREERMPEALRRAIGILQLDDLWEKHWCEMFRREDLIRDLKEIGEAMQFIARDHRRLFHALRKARHELVSARMAADGWKELYDELSDVAHQD